MIFVALLEAVLQRNSFKTKALTNSINGLIIVVIIVIFAALTLIRRWYCGRGWCSSRIGRKERKILRPL